MRERPHLDKKEVRGKEEVSLDEQEKKKDSSNDFFKPPHGKAYRGIKEAGVYLRLLSRQIKTYVEHFLLEKTKSLKIPASFIQQSCNYLKMLRDTRFDRNLISIFHMLPIASDISVPPGAKFFLTSYFLLQKG